MKLRSFILGMSCVFLVTGCGGGEDLPTELTDAVKAQGSYLCAVSLLSVDDPDYATKMVSAMETYGAASANIVVNEFVASVEGNDEEKAKMGITLLRLQQEGREAAGCESP